MNINTGEAEVKRLMQLPKEAIAKRCVAAERQRSILRKTVQQLRRTMKILIWKEETDGDVLMAYKTDEQIDELTKPLDTSDYAVVEGTIIKSFKQ